MKTILGFCVLAFTVSSLYATPMDTAEGTVKNAQQCTGQIIGQSGCENPTTGPQVSAIESQDKTAQTQVTTTGPQKRTTIAPPTPPNGQDVSNNKDNGESGDPNKWNRTIAGGKMALWAGLIGFVFGGPAGLVVAAMIGFGAGYFMGHGAPSASSGSSDDSSGGGSGSGGSSHSLNNNVLGSIHF
jgi:hypothetical protein